MSRGRSPETLDFSITRVFNGSNAYLDLGAAAATHTHTRSDITDFSHTHPTSDITGYKTGEWHIAMFLDSTATSF